VKWHYDLSKAYLAVNTDLSIYEAQRAVLLAKKLRLEGRGIVLQCDKNMGSPFSCQFPVAIPELLWAD
jgi:hypothetical protein